MEAHSTWNMCWSIKTEQQQETERTHISEREKWEELLKSSRNEIELLSRDYEKFATQLQEKDEQIEALHQIKTQLQSAIEVN